VERRGGRCQGSGVSDGELILIAGLLLAGSVGAALLAAGLQLPTLVLFLAVGALAGRWVQFDDYASARRIGTVALALILFDGGLGSSLGALRSVLRPALALAIPGTLATALATGVCASVLFGLPLLGGLLVGSIVASTDGSAVFTMLRGTSLRPRLARILEAETGLNDPVAVLLVIGFTAWQLQPGYGAGDMAWLLVRELVVGGVAGLAVGRLGAAAYAHLRLPEPGLFPVASLAAAALAYGTADVLGGSGFLAVYLAGLALGGTDIPARRTVAVFHRSLAWVAQVTMFSILGLLLVPGRLGQWLGPSIALAVVLLCVARPIAVFALTAPERLDAAERAALAWAGLRGAVPIVLATFPVLAGVDRAERVFSVVFFVVLFSTLVQGTTFPLLARALGVTTSAPPLPEPLTEHGARRGLGGEVVEHPVARGDAIVGQRVGDLGLPSFAHVALVVRGEEAIPPPASWRIAAGDVLHVLAREEVLDEVLAQSATWRRGPPALLVVPWDAGHGDPARPAQVLGVVVAERVRVRRDRPGALLRLADGRHAVTGPVIAVAGDAELAGYARRRLRLAADREEAVWWRAVVAALDRV
jgi:potassium/hydrogen antiporter